MISEFKRPFGTGRDDPEEQFRAGYQLGALALLDAIKAGRSQTDLHTWIEVDLQKWRHDRNADPTPPAP